MDRYRKRRFRKEGEALALAMICGRIPGESVKAAALLRVHRGEAEPSSEIEKQWMEYWDGDPPPESELKDVYLDRAKTSQQPGASYEEILHAYKLAAICGSEQARSWLLEQKLEPLRVNTIWNTIDKEIWDLNG